MSELINIGVDRLKRAIEIHKPSHVFALYSGGNDSRCGAEIACRVPQFSGCVHCNTGIGVEETREHVRETCREKGWPLLEYKATENTFADGRPDPQDYDTIVRQNGFPGPGQHWRMYVRLKDRGLARLMREHKQHNKDRVIFVSGVRSAESVRRMGTVEEVKRDGGRVWVAPIHDWQTSDKESVFQQQGIKGNPVVECLGMSGECLCGAFATPGEEKKVAHYFPYIGERLNRLYEQVKDKFPWRWDQKPPAKPKDHRDQTLLPFMPMCWNCNKRETVWPYNLASK